MTGSYAASFLPWILIPVIGWVFPAVVMGIFLPLRRERSLSASTLLLPKSLLLEKGVAHGRPLFIA